MQIKLSKKVVEETKPEATDVFLWDSELPGFGCKITPLGKRVYVVQYRRNGQSRRLTLGQHGTLTIEQARQHARGKLGRATLGEDPAAEQITARRGPTVSELADRYIAEHAERKKKPKSVHEDKRLLETIIKPKLGASKVLEVSRADIAELHHKLGDETPTQANRVLALLRKMFNLAEQWEIRLDGTNPCRHVQSYKENKRRRFLSIDELTRLGAVLAKAETEQSEPMMAVACFRLLIFTGARLDEILTLKWEFVKWELDAILLPDSKTGFKALPLSAAVREVLKSLPVVQGNAYVLPGRKKGKHLVGVQHIWERIHEAAQITDLRLHDLRHSYASVGAASGLGLPIIGALLGHSQPATTQRYAHLAADPLKAAAELISGKIDQAMKQKPKMHVVK
jgi:integrase